MTKAGKIQLIHFAVKWDPIWHEMDWPCNRQKGSIYKKRSRIFIPP